MLSEHPKIMGVLNLTPDSFSDGNSYPDVESAAKRIEYMIAEGAEIIDIGGESTRPQAHPIDAETEWKRLEKVLGFAVKQGTPVSIDTYKPAVAERALAMGAKIINDIAPFDHLEEVIHIAKRYSADLIVTHNSRKHPFEKLEDLLIDIISQFQLAIKTAELCGYDPQGLIFDIGLGFGKTNKQDVALLRELKNIRAHFLQRFLLGASRKSFMKIFGEQTTETRLPCTLAATISGYLSGCNIFRVHDVRENYETLKFVKAVYGKQHISQ